MATIKCKHPYLVPLQIKFGQIQYQHPFPNKIYDWSSTIIGAHIARVATYYCPLCGEEITAPEPKDKTNDPVTKPKFS